MFWGGYIVTKRKSVLKLAGGIVALSAIFATPLGTLANVQNNPGTSVSNGKDAVPTTTPIKHVVVIFGENVSFDHYFGTYPYATNPAGEPAFHAAANTPTDINNYITHPDLLTNNPNRNLDGSVANPQRLDRSQPITASMNHGYTAEQTAFDGGKMDNFVKGTGRGSSVVMNYYDGNTVTAMWNYAQNFAMSDNSFGTMFGPSTPGALNLISGQTSGATAYKNDVAQTADVPGNVAKGSVIGDPDPYFDTASNHPGTTAAMSSTNKNVGDLLNAKDITWGWFQGGFSNPTATHQNVGGGTVTDYSPHHEPFQYYQSTANPKHLPPSSVAMIGQTDQAKHQYDITDFWAAVNAHNMPSVSFLKAPAYEDGHPGYSDPLDEQQFVVNTINQLEQTPEWKNTAVILAYDDSDGWYDHVIAGNTANTVANGSQDLSTDTLFGPGNAGVLNPLLGTAQDRAGYGPRLPLLVVSPYVKQNYVDHTLTDQSSILKFIEDNWNLGRIGNGSFDAVAGSLNNMFDFSHGPRANKLFLDPSTGEPVADQN